MTRRTHRLDVRAEIRNGKEPFSRIMQTVAALDDNDDLLLIAPFAPEPLFGILAERGFSHEAREISGGDWEVRFHRSGDPALADGKREQREEPEAREIDTRGLVPPQPLVLILEAVNALPPGAELKARIDRRPAQLYEALLDRGFSGQTEEEPDGTFLIRIRPLRKP